jgi:hypothetical protein
VTNDQEKYQNAKQEYRVDGGVADGDIDDAENDAPEELKAAYCRVGSLGYVHGLICMFSLVGADLGKCDLVEVLDSRTIYILPFAILF